MDETGPELTLDDLPSPPLFKLVDPEGRDVFQETEVGGERARSAPCSRTESSQVSSPQAPPNTEWRTSLAWIQGRSPIGAQ